MISNVLKDVRKVFTDNWIGEFQIGNTQYKAIAESWINFDVEPIFTESVSYSGCVAEEHALYVTCYHRNQLLAAELADEVISFMRNRQSDMFSTRAWRPVTQGMMDDGKAFYKIAIPLEVIN